MQRVEYFRVDNSEEFMMSEQRNPSYHNKVCMVDIDVLPFLNVGIVLQSGKVDLEVQEIANSWEKQSNYDYNFGQGVVDPWLEVSGEG